MINRQIYTSVVLILGIFAVMHAPHLVHAQSGNTTTYQSYVQAIPDNYTFPSRGQATMNYTIAFNVNYTEQLNNRVKECFFLAFKDVTYPGTNTIFYDWRRFTSVSNGIIYVSTIKSGDAEGLFSSTATNYVENRRLNQTGLQSLQVCINMTDFAMTGTPVLKDFGTSSLYASASNWIIAIVCAGLVAAIAVVAAYFILKRKNKTYPPADYKDEKDYDSE